MAAAKIAMRREGYGDFPAQQQQVLAQQAATKTNQQTDVLAVLNNRAWIALATDTGALIAAAYATLLETNINTLSSSGFLLVTFSASGLKPTAAGTVFFQLMIDNVVQKGLYTTPSGVGFSWNIAMVFRVAVRKGRHNVRLQWKTNTNSVSISAKSTIEEHANLLVQELAS